MSRQNDIVTLLGGCALFQGAGAEDLAALGAMAGTTRWPRGTLIFQQGDASQFLAVVETGRIRLSLVTAAGKELVLRHAQKGEVLGEMGVLDHQPRSAGATAVTAAQGLVIQRAAFERVLAERPALAATVIRYLAGRLRDTTYQLESVALYSLSGRLARFILAAAGQAGGAEAMRTGRARLTLDLGQGEIAAILGASRPKLNRAFAELGEMGAIARHDRDLDCDLRLLHEIAEADEA